MPRANSLIGLLILSLVLGNAVADEKKPQDADKADKGAKKAQQAERMFEQLKSLAGVWVATKGANKGQVALDVRVIAGGSAVVEREFPGSDHEMVTVYHLDGNKLMLNHYCMLGNQPRMRAQPGKEANTILFKFGGVANADPKTDDHMHEGKLVIVDKDHIKATWIMFKQGKAAEEHTFEMARKTPGG